VNLSSLKITLAIFAFLGLLIAADSAHSADQDFFDISNLEIEGKIFNFVSGDFNGDKLADIVLIYSTATDPDNRYIGLFIQTADKKFSKNPNYLTVLPAGVVQVNAGDVDNDGRDEIVAIDAEGVSLLKYTLGSGFALPVRLIRQSTIFAVPMLQGIIIDRFLFDIVSRPGTEIIIPTSKGYGIFERGDDGNYQILNQLSFLLFCQNSGREIRDFSHIHNSGFQTTLASIRVIDGNLDGRMDLYFLWDKRVCCFFQDATGNFSKSPDFQLDLYPLSSDGFFQSDLADFNNDRRPDLIVTHTAGGITRTESKIRFYAADIQGKIKAPFTKEITLSDSHCNLMIGDYNGDKQQELVIPALELGAIAATKMLLMKKADLYLLIYPIVNGLPEDEPLQRIGYEFRFNFDESMPTREVNLNWTADYNGDGLADLVFSDGGGRVLFFWGKVVEFISKKSDMELILDHPAEIHPIHLGNGVNSDIVIEHNLSGKFDRLTLLRNKSDLK
jgi:hypothetical protein